MAISRGFGRRKPFLGLLGAVGFGALMLSLPSMAIAGEVYGRIATASGPVGEGATVGATCGDKSFPPQPTDKGGSYHIVIGATGKCSLQIAWKGQTAELPVVSYDQGAQVDIVLETKDGKLSARRR